MPKSGYPIRTLAVLAAVAAVFAALAVGAGAAPAKHAGTTISGAGSTFVAPLVAQWISPLGAAYGYELQYSAVGSGAGITVDHVPHRRLRRERRAVDPRPVHGLQRLRADPLGARRDRGPLQPARRQEPAAHGRADAGEDLHGPDHDLERPGDREAQPGRLAAEHEDQRSPTAPTTPARRSTSPTTSRASARRGSRRSGRGSPSTGRSARPARAARASPRSSRRRRAGSATRTSRTR